jgi:hypothetical protein
MTGTRIERARDLARRFNRPRVEMPRWFLTVLYTEFAVLGVVAAIRGVPTIDLTTFEGYTLFWGATVALAAGMSATFSVRKEWEKWERWSVSALAALILGYAYAGIRLVTSGTPAESSARVAFSIVLIIIGTILAGRAVQLLSRIGTAR